jgi:hypothetical protein
MLALLLLVGLAAATTNRGRRNDRRRDDGGERLRLDLVIGVWTGPEQKSFQAVIDGFKEKTRT